MEEIKTDIYTFDKHSQCLLFDSFDIYEGLRVKHRIHAEPIGTMVTNQNQNELLGPPFTLNLLQTLHLIN